MHYYRKTDIANLYGVNPRTVARWIEESRHGQLGLDLYDYEGKTFIAKTSKNQRIMRDLALERRKYLNKNNLKVLQPKPEFYEIFSEEQILELISGLDTYHEIPLKFSYFQDGAKEWDKYAQHLYEDKEEANTLTSTIKLLGANMGYFDTLFEDYERINVIDVGVGNALSSKNLLSHLIGNNKLGRYIAIDISNEMLHIAENNFLEWFGSKATFEGYTNDISFEYFTDVVAEPPGSTINLVLVLGGTLANFDAPEDALKVIRKSMGRDDLFLYCAKLDSALTREQFNIESNKEGQSLSARHRYVLDLLGIEETQYNVEAGYDEARRARYMQIRLKQAITVEFNLPRGIWRVDFNKADAIVVWHANHHTSFEIEKLLYDNGFNPLQTSQTTDHNYMLVVADLRKYGRNR